MQTESRSRGQRQRGVGARTRPPRARRGPAKTKPGRRTQAPTLYTPDAVANYLLEMASTSVPAQALDEKSRYVAKYLVEAFDAVRRVDLQIKGNLTSEEVCSQILCAPIGLLLLEINVKLCAFDYWERLARTPAKFDKQLFEQILKPLRSLMKAVHGIRPHHPRTKHSRDAEIWEFRRRHPDWSYGRIGTQFGNLKRNAIANILKRQEVQKQMERPVLVDSTEAILKFFKERRVTKGISPSVTPFSVIEAIRSLVTDAESGTVMQNDTSICKPTHPN